ncbi:30S ribosomal protein S6 [Patescibacteria group bacterium]|nr:30S ribosomal protein S6 [Patescibacteria group bacterium]
MLSTLDLIKEKAMGIYEMTFAFNSQAEEEKKEELLEKIESFIGKKKGKVEKINQLGKRRFAYEVNKEKEGFFITLVLQMEPAGVEGLYKFANSDNSVIRLMIVKKKNLSLEKLNQKGEGNVSSKQSDTNRQFNSGSRTSLHT